MLGRRKVVQITAVQEGEHLTSNLFALCDDGSLFMMSWDDRGGALGWGRLDGPPEVDAGLEEVVRQLILPWSEFSDAQLDQRQMFDPGFREALKDARRLLGWRSGIDW